ncbi:hypothetical protein T01_9971, partial [Trichinella spiralis]
LTRFQIAANVDMSSLKSLMRPFNLTSLNLINQKYCLVLCILCKNFPIPSGLLFCIQCG